MIAMIGHAIIRHRLMDIRVVIKKGAVYVTAFVVAGALLTALIVGSVLLLPNGRWGMGREILLGLFVAFLFHPLKGGIQRGFDRYLYRRSYSFEQTVREASRKMATMLDLRTLGPYLCEVIDRTVHPERITIYIRNSVTGEYHPAVVRHLMEPATAEGGEPVPGSSPLPQLLGRKQAHLLRHDLRGGDPSGERRGVLDVLLRLGGELAVPIWDEDRLLGFVVVGPKMSGDLFFSEDLDLLSTLAGQAAIAIKNAQLYHEVVLVNEYIQNILQTMESGVVAVGIDRLITLFNPAAERITGLPAPRLRSGPISQLPPALSGPIEATLVDGQPRPQVETALTDATGRTTPVVCSVSPFRDPQDHLLGAVLVMSDLTQLKELEAERRRAERLAAFEAMAARAAHEIKNPLVAIQTFVQLLPRKFADEEFRENFSRVAVREIQRISALADRLRGLGRSSSQPLMPLDLREPIEDTLALLRGQLEQSSIAVKRAYGDELPQVAGDPAQLKQLFLNLFINALEAMEPGGELALRLERREACGKRTLAAEIADTGTGIPEPILARMFDPFMTTKPRGSGLGLSICQAIANAHQATIHAGNNPRGSGAIVTIEFPAAPAAAAPPST